ncbi:MAG: hypothetical protein K5764_01510 [Prevotella sp.]|nr:hypothetical protein [Prevotella sp.]
MNRLNFFLISIAALLLTACGGKSGGSSSSSEASGSSETSGLADGKWPAAVYDKYNIPEIETKGRIVYTEFGEDNTTSHYRVSYNGVTKEEMQAYVKKLQEKGFRVPSYTQERINNGRSDLDAVLFLPGEKNEVCYKIGFDFEHIMSFEYYADDPNPAFEIVERDGERVIEYNFFAELNPMKTAVENEGDFEALGLKAADLSGIPFVRKVKMESSANGASIGVTFFGDHQLAEGDMDVIHDKLAETLEAKGAKFYHTFSGKVMTAAQLKADKVRGYVVEKDGKKFQMMAMSDDRVGDFGVGIDYRFMLMRK